MSNGRAYVNGWNNAVSNLQKCRTPFDKRNHALKNTTLHCRTNATDNHFLCGRVDCLLAYLSDTSKLPNKLRYSDD